MKKVIVIIILLLIVSCDPIYRVTISNNSTRDITLITEPPIEKNCFNSDAVECISQIKMKIKMDDSDNSKGYYKIPSGNEIFLFSTIGIGPGNYLPYKKVMVLYGNDTIKIDSLNLRKTINKKVKNSFYIEVQ